MVCPVISGSQETHRRGYPETIVIPKGDREISSLTEGLSTKDPTERPGRSRIRDTLFKGSKVK